MQPPFAAFPHALHAGGGWDLDCGIQLADRLEAASMREVTAELHSVRLRGGSAGADWVALSIEPLRTAFVGTSLVDDVTVRAAAVAHGDPAVEFWLPPMVSAWGTVD
jgi:hypothetical protein